MHSNPPSSRAKTRTMMYSSRGFITNALLLFIVVLLPNVYLLSHNVAYENDRFGIRTSLSHLLLWFLANLILLGVLYLTRLHLLQPINLIKQHIQRLRSIYVEEGRSTLKSPLSLLHAAREVSQFANFALDHYKKHQEITVELEKSRFMIAQFTKQQETTLSSTNREIGEQYRSVLAYANYLEHQIQHNKIDPSIRYDFDDVCESSFNLKLIAGALSSLSHPPPQISECVALATLVQQTMLTLAPALDRRAMKLTSADVDLSVAAQGDPQTLAQVLWMMLLGMIRYAEDESTLRIRCFHSRDGSHALLSIVISELSPGKMSQEERQDHLIRQLQHLTPHMFAETIRIHGNVQLADMLIQRIGGSITTLPLTVASCEICMKLPSAVIRTTCE
jgi:hypothetical protein